MAPTPRYRVIANCEDEYALWPMTTTVPSPWRCTGVIGSWEECMAFVRRLDTATDEAVVRRFVEHDSVQP